MCRFLGCPPERIRRAPLALAWLWLHDAMLAEGLLTRWMVPGEDKMASLGRFRAMMGGNAARVGE